jgi:hypothetical protein
MLHWNGTSWRRASVPDLGGTGAGAINVLSAVRCLTARSCWAVGDYDNKSGATLTVALRWNGTKWSRVTTPSPAGARAGNLNELFDVTCVSAANCWSVGDYGTPYSTNQKLLNLVLHWNGKHWSRLRVANPGGTTFNHLNSVFGVRCGSPRNCDAVGSYGTTPGGSYRMFNEAFHWNGTKWSLVRTPDPGGTGTAKYSEIEGLACGSAANCWGAVSYGTFLPPSTIQPMAARNELLHWNGKTWTKVTASDPAGTKSGDVSQLIFDTCSSAANCWAVGALSNAAGATLNDTLHWNGKKWPHVSAPSPAGLTKGLVSTPTGVRCTAASNCWAVGFQQLAVNDFQDEILHWNGTKWTVHPAPPGL